MEESADLEASTLTESVRVDGAIFTSESTEGFSLVEKTGVNETDGATGADSGDTGAAALR